MNVKISDCFFESPIAHRGLHNESLAENSLGAFRSAIDNHYAIEIDVHLLKDGRLAIVHDSNIERVTGHDLIVEDLTRAELKLHPLLIGGETIPTFKEFLKTVDGKTPILIELKFSDRFDPRQADELLRELSDYPYKDKVCLQSFHPQAVRYLKKKTQEYAVGQLSGKDLNTSKINRYFLSKLIVVRYNKADFISYDINGLPSKHVERWQKKGKPLFTWTIDTEEKLHKARQSSDNFIFETINPRGE